MNRTVACKVFRFQSKVKLPMLDLNLKGINAISAACEGIAGCKLGKLIMRLLQTLELLKAGQPEMSFRLCLWKERSAVLVMKLNKTLDGILMSFRTLEITNEVKVNIESTTSFEMVNIAPSAPVVKLGEKSIRDCGYEPILVTAGGGSDANALAAKGIDAINLGIGYRNVHSPAECVAINDLYAVARIVMSIIQNAQYVF